MLALRHCGALPEKPMSVALAVAASAAIATVGAGASLASLRWLESPLIATLLAGVTVIAASQCWTALTAADQDPRNRLPGRFHHPHSRLRQRHQPARRLPRAPLARR